MSKEAWCGNCPVTTQPLHQDGENLLSSTPMHSEAIKQLAAERDTLDGIVSENISRRCEIEQHLMNVATGKAPLLTEQDCRILALRLGTPKAQWNDAIKKYKFGGLQ